MTPRRPRPASRAARGPALATVLTLAGFCLAGCDAAAEVEGLVGSLRSDDQTDPTVGQPSPGSPETGPGAAPDVQGPASLLAGGVGRYALSSAAPIDAVLVGVVGQDGFFRLPTGGDAAVAVRVELAPGAAPRAYTLRFWTEAGDGPASAPTDVGLTVLPAGDAGELQVTLSWDAPADLDLHVLEPAGLLLGPDGQPAREEIWWNNPTGLSGGTLARDTAASCLRDDASVERITWLSPLAGPHAVLVDPWSACGATAAIGWQVTVTVRGEQVATASGTFDPTDQTMGSACVGAVGELEGGVPDPDLGDGLARRCPKVLTFTYALPE